MRPVEPPHFARIRDRIARLETPLIVLWGWPGSGNRAILRALLANGELEAEPVRAAEIASARDSQATLERARAGRRSLLVCDQPEGAHLVPLLDELLPNEQVIASSTRATPPHPRVTVIGPRELCLLAEEWSAIRPGGGRDDDAWSRCEGWYEALRLWEPGSADGGRAVARFLETRVLRPLDAAERGALRSLARGEPHAADEAAVGELEKVHGLIWRRGGRWRMPRLLRRHLRSAASRSRSAAAGGEASGKAEARFHVRLLGPAAVDRVTEDGTAIRCTWRTLRPLKILIYLLLNDELAAGRDEIVEAVWPEANQDEVDRNLHPTFSLLRRQLGSLERGRGSVVQLRNGVYRLEDPEGWAVDLRRFDDAYRHGCTALEKGDVPPGIEHLERARSLFHGPFCQGLDDPWILARRDHVQRRYIEALRRLGELYLQRQRWEAAEDALRSVLFEEPLQEEVYVSLMRAYAARGRRDLVRRQYERMCHVLQSELGVEPSQATLSEFNRLLR